MSQDLVRIKNSCSRLKVIISSITLLGLWTITPELYCMTCPETSHVAKVGFASNSSDTVPQLNVVVVDRGSGARWATVMDCKHPEWPARMVLLPASSSQVPAEAREVAVVARHHFFVRAGEKVKLWSSDDLLRIEVDGIAEETKEEGQRIRVRLIQHMGSYGQSPERQLMGVVRGSGDVELVR
jgi:hypothetical protein